MYYFLFEGIKNVFKLGVIQKIISKSSSFFLNLTKRSENGFKGASIPNDVPVFEGKHRYSLQKTFLRIFPSP